MELTVEQRNKEVTEEIFRLVNFIGNRRDLANKIKEHLNREHRTIQQSFLSVLKDVIEDYGKPENNTQTDLRNSAARHWAQTVYELDVKNNLDTVGFPFV